MTIMIGWTAAAARASMFLFLSTQQCSRVCLGSKRSQILRLFASHHHSSNLISSTQSKVVKRLQALQQRRKKRVEYGETVVEGPRMIFDLIKNPNTRSLVQQIVISTDKWEIYYPQLETLLVADTPSSADEADSANSGPVFRPPRILPATPQVLEACTDTVTTQGVVALVQIPSLKPSLPSSSSSRPPLFVVVDALQDPGNMGTLIRSCVATSVTAFCLLPGSCDPWNPKAVRSAMGTTFSMPLLPCASWDDCMRQLNEWGCERIYAATMLEEDDNYSNTAGIRRHYDVDWTSEPTAVVLGAEGKGLSETVRQAVRDGPVQAVYVPMEAGVESLNAAVCGSIILFEALRQGMLYVQKTNDHV